MPSWKISKTFQLKPKHPVQTKPDHQELKPNLAKTQLQEPAAIFLCHVSTHKRWCCHSDSCYGSRPSWLFPRVPSVPPLGPEHSHVHTDKHTHTHTDKNIFILRYEHTEICMHTWPDAQSLYTDTWAGRSWNSDININEEIINSLQQTILFTIWSTEGIMAEK